MKLELTLQNSLCQYNGKTFIIPESLEIRNNVGYSRGVFEKRISLSKDMGLEIIERPFTFNCVHQSNCIGYKDRDNPCEYVLDDDQPQWLFMNTNTGNGEISIQRMTPCIADTALLITAIEEGKLNKHEIETKNIDAKKFPFQWELRRDASLKETTRQLYTEMVEEYNS